MPETPGRLTLRSYVHQTVNRPGAEQPLGTGYSHAEYAYSLSEFGRPQLLPRAGGWILERPIDGFPYHDAMGCYPIFICENWARLKDDLEQMRNGLVCLSLVADPFGEYEVDFLRQCFPDLLLPYKQHFVVDLRYEVSTFAHAQHRRKARKGLRQLEVERCADPTARLQDWTMLYRTLIERHDIKGIAAFSKESFARQLHVPGIQAFRAVHNGSTVGMLLWYERGKKAYFHLGAFSHRGYELLASFALIDQAIKYFAQQRFEWLDLGAGAGIGGDASSGLTRFKSGWSTGVKTAYFCARIFDHKRYREIVDKRELPKTNYFPAYRAGELF